MCEIERSAVHRDVSAGCQSTPTLIPAWLSAAHGLRPSFERKVAYFRRRVSGPGAVDRHLDLRIDLLSSRGSTQSWQTQNSRPVDTSLARGEGRRHCVRTSKSAREGCGSSLSKGSGRPQGHLCIRCDDLERPVLISGTVHRAGVSVEALAVAACSRARYSSSVSGSTEPWRKRNGKTNPSAGANCPPARSRVTNGW